MGGAETLTSSKGLPEEAYVSPLSRSDSESISLSFEKGELIYLAARPSMGKSGLAFGIARQAAVHSANVTADGKQKAVACFSLEMSREMVTNRWLAENARIDLRRLRQGSCNASPTCH